MRRIAKEWGAFGVRANTVAFGYITTRLTGAKELGEAITLPNGEKVALGIPGRGKGAQTDGDRIPDSELHGRKHLVRYKDADSTTLFQFLSVDLVLPKKLREQSCSLLLRSLLTAAVLLWKLLEEGASNPAEYAANLSSNFGLKYPCSETIAERGFVKRLSEHWLC